MNLLPIVFHNIVFCFAASQNRLYLPTWDDLNKRPLPAWYDRSKIGILIHWGVYSVPAFATPTAGAESFVHEWRTAGDSGIKKYLDSTFSRDTNYRDMAGEFTAEYFYPDEWAELFKQSGAKYVILTAKGKDGFALFEQEIIKEQPKTTWSSVATGPHRDLVEDVQAAVTKQHLKFGIYYSLPEWYSKLYMWDKKHHFTTNYYVSNKVTPHLHHLVKKYRPSVIWADGFWEEDSSSKYWNATNFLAWLYNDSPVKRDVVVNDRWGLDTSLRCGDFYTGPDRYNPKVRLAHKWEYAFGLDKHSWGYSKNRVDLMAFDELLETVVSTVSFGGNILINISPTKEGEIPEPFQKSLLALGSWLRINGQAIYGTKPWEHQHEKENNVWFTCKPTKEFKYNGSDPISTPEFRHIRAIYAIFFSWPEDFLLRIKAVRKLFRNREQYVEILDKTVKPIEWWELTNEAVVIKLPEFRPTEDYGWTLRFTKVPRAGPGGEHY